MINGLGEVVGVSVCRISIQTDLDDGRTFDVAVAAQTPVGALLPAVVDVVGLHSAPDTVGGWRLDRAAGAPLDESLSLTDNGLHDGDLLILTTTAAPTLGPLGAGPARTVASAGRPVPVASERLRESACAWLAVVAAVALAWTGAAGDTGHLIVAACGACVVCWRSTVTRSTAVALAGCTLAATAGFVAVPSGPGAANVFLSATAVFAVTLVMTRLSSRPCGALISTVSCTALAMVTMAVAVLVELPVATVGAVLATGALGLLSVAPRLSAAWARLGPRSEAEAAEAVVAQAETGHTTLTGLVAGCAIGVAAGAILVALGTVRAQTSPLAGGAFALATSLVLLLRARTYVDGARCLVLVVNGLCCLTASFAILCAANPHRVTWNAIGLMAIGLGTLHRGISIPIGGRFADLLDHAALAAVVPLACWVIGLYGMARDWQLA
jgi:type VII secretion integral membrane protein EccD